MIKENITEYLASFKLKSTIDEFINPSLTTKVEPTIISNQPYNKYINEYWTAKQRQASSIHEISYRACFKPQLPKFFIKLLSQPKDLIYDPFSGRGTTAIEAGLLNRNVLANDINPLSKILAIPRLSIPKLKDVEERVKKISVKEDLENDLDLSMFYHENTEREILSIRQYLNERKIKNEEDDIDRFIRMVATNRLTGHSKGFFSVYTLPPNQAVSQESQIKINLKRNQKPDYRDIKSRIIKKIKSLLRNLTERQIGNLNNAGKRAIFLSKNAEETYEIEDDSVQLTVTSPPFLKVVQYAKDNWLRCWFNSIDTEEISKKITMEKKVEGWSKVMSNVFIELYRITKKEGWVAFEVGEVKKGTINLDDYVIPVGLSSGFTCKGILVNSQQFTKTSRIWGIDNNKLGTNTNRIVLFKKDK